jgi:signal transduction histidine kinase
MSLGTLWLLVWMARRLRAQPSVETLMYALMLVVTLASGVYDQLLNALLLPELWRQRFYIAHLVVPLVFLAFVAQLALRVVRSVRSVRAANESLEARVAAASREVAEAYERERVLLAERSATRERERIYRDLHDNLGARLLSLVYSARDERQAGMAREALGEMRQIIAASQVEGGLLGDLAAEWRLEAELRAEDRRMLLDWTVQGEARLAGRQRYQLECIVRELVSNALEHSGGSEVQVTWRVEGTWLQLGVRDDGRGLPGGPRPGTGLQGVRQRAADLGGTAHWAPATPRGVDCRVEIPLDEEALP